MLELNGYNDNRNIYIKDYNLLFFKIPKVAITSIWQVSANLLGHQLTQEAQLRKFGLPSIRSQDLYKYPEVYKVAFIRNPWERLLSCYLQKKKKKETIFFDRNGLNKAMTFEEFGYAVCQIPDHKADRHFRSQYTFIYDHESRLLANFVGDFSSFEKDLNTVLKNVNAPKVTIPHYNKTSHSKYMDYYSEELKEAVGQRYKLDLEIFGFEYGKSTTDDLGDNWKAELSDSIKKEMLMYKTNKLLHCLNYTDETMIPKPRTLRKRIKFLLKGI